MISKDRAREMVIDATLHGWQLWLASIESGFRHGIIAEADDGSRLYMFGWKPKQKEPISINRAISTEQAFELIEKNETMEGWNG